MNQVMKFQHLLKMVKSVFHFLISSDSNKSVPTEETQTKYKRIIIPILKPIPKGYKITGEADWSKAMPTSPLANLGKCYKCVLIDEDNQQ